MATDIGTPASQTRGRKSTGNGKPTPGKDGASTGGRVSPAEAEKRAQVGRALEQLQPKPKTPDKLQELVEQQKAENRARARAETARIGGPNMRFTAGDSADTKNLDDRRKR